MVHQVAEELFTSGWLASLPRLVSVVLSPRSSKSQRTPMNSFIWRFCRRCSSSRDSVAFSPRLRAVDALALVQV